MPLDFVAWQLREKSGAYTPGSPSSIYFFAMYFFTISSLISIPNPGPVGIST